MNILRGIKEKYESYHGIRISDRALVVAAELSHRYIQDRFLPDKAIDLVCALVSLQPDASAWLGKCCNGARTKRCNGAHISSCLQRSPKC